MVPISSDGVGGHGLGWLRWQEQAILWCLGAGRHRG